MLHCHGYQNGQQWRSICSPLLPLLLDQIVAKRPCYGPFKLTPSYNINLIGVISLCMLLTVADNNGCHFGHHCGQQVSPISIKHRGQHKYIYFYIYVMNLLELFDGSLGKTIRKAAQPSSSMALSDLCCWRVKRLHHHGDGVC
jgi:hypothetical protein